MKLRMLFILIASNAASAQLISIGVKGGIPLSKQTTNSNDESHPYIVGPSIEIRLPAHFAVEASALYQRLGSSSAFQFNDGLSISKYNIRERANSWEFPILGKYYFRSPSETWQPYLGTGYVFRTIRIQRDTRTQNTESMGAKSSSTNHYEYGTGLGMGATAAAGVRFRSGRFAIVPEIRYTRRGGNATYQIPRNDVKLLVGFTS